MTFSPGTVLNNRYRIVRLLGQGGFGAVYRAWDLNLERPCAFKENLDTSAEAQRQFKREAKMLADLSHPNLPRVTDHFSLEGQGQYLVMDFIEGQDLQSLMEERGPLAEDQVIGWISQVCEALNYLHSQNPPIIHRDIKPANIRITSGGKAVLVDFGIAKIFDSALSTTVGARAITPGYSPPEQYGRARTDARSDIYALGATCYAALTGKAPVESVMRMSGAALPYPTDLNASVKPGVANAVLKAMALKPEDRFSSAAELGKALIEPPQVVNQPRTSLSGTTVVVERATPVQSPYQAGPAARSNHSGSPWAPAPARSRRLNLWVVLFGVLAVFFVGMIGMGLWGISNLIDRQPDTTSTEAAVQTFPTTTSLVEVDSPGTTPVIAKPPPTSTRQALPTHTPTPAGPPARLTDPKGVEMALVSAGEFLMGRDDELSFYPEEKPVHTVYLDEYYIDVYEVTNSAYEGCVNAGKCSPPGETSSKTRSVYFGSPEYADFPVIHVSWEQATTFCAWRGARLPTEAEWEKAARGGVKGAKYPWGDEEATCERANFYTGKTECVGDTNRVGSYPANEFGLYDMAGNVWEWVTDWLSKTYYAESPNRNPPGPSSGEYRGFRGGAWSVTDYTLRNSARSGFISFFSGNNLGFRCASSP